MATRRDVEAKHEVEPEQIVEQLSIATSFLLGTEASAGRAHMGGQDRILVDVHVSSFVDLGLERHEYVYWMLDTKARAMLLAFSKKAYNNENVEFLIAGKSIDCCFLR